MESEVVAVRRSTVHGRGAFARFDLAARRTILDYEGERITWERRALITVSGASTGIRSTSTWATAGHRRWRERRTLAPCVREWQPSVSGVMLAR
jgi:hypothetical protein